MITFEEYLKGVENTPTINEEQEFLEEAYTPEMKQLISKEELSKIGNFINKRFDISAQNTNFHSLQNISTQNMKDYDHAIVVMNSGLVSIVKKSKNSLEYVYPQNYGTLTAKDVKNIKAAFVFNWKVQNDTSILRQERQRVKPGEDILLKKSQRLQKKIEYSKNKAIEDLKTLCAKHDLTIRYAYAVENGRWAIGVERDTNIGSVDLNYSTEYSKTPRAEIRLGGKLITSIADFKSFLTVIQDFDKFIDALEKLSPSFSSLPIH